MDLIFSKFKIKRLAGKVHLPDYDMIDFFPEHYLQRVRNGALRNEDGSLNKQAILDLTEHGNDVERINGLYYLVKHEGLNMIQSAREFMHLDWDDFDETRQAAIWVIGKQGDESDLPMLFDEYFGLERRYVSHSICRCSTLVPKRNIMDAIEQIKSRCN